MTEPCCERCGNIWMECGCTQQHIVMYSGGASSWMTARRVARRHGTRNLTLLFADTMMEDHDLYRFLEESAKNVGGELVWIREGRDPWQVFHDVRYLGNTRIDPCSRILKRDIMRKWLNEHCDPESTVVYLGFDWTELHRFERSKKYWDPWRVECPMTEKPYLTRQECIDELYGFDIEPPDLYKQGFPHNNCGGFCIKAGHAHFRHLLLHRPHTYAYHERKEQEIRDYLGKDVTILRDRRGGKVTPITMKEFRQRLEDGGQCDLFDWGGCACMDAEEEGGESD